MCERGQFPACASDRTNTRNGRSLCFGRGAEPTDPANARRKHAALQPCRITWIDFGLLHGAAPARIETRELVRHAQATHRLAGPRLHIDRIADLRYRIWPDARPPPPVRPRGLGTLRPNSTHPASAVPTS